MLVKGTKELFAEEAALFLKIRNNIDTKLIQLGFNFFYTGILSKKFIYENNLEILGEEFKDIIFDINCRENDVILSPEGTFRVYEYLNRIKFLENNKAGKVFYSQEFLRNETLSDIEKGKTISFWQTGYELFSDSDEEVAKEGLHTLLKCLETLKNNKIKIRISDKRILDGILSEVENVERNKIYVLLDKSQENIEIFYNEYIKNFKNTNIATKIYELFKIKIKDLEAIEHLNNLLNNNISRDGISNIKNIYKEFKETYPNFIIEIVPYISKTWNAYTTLLFDAWIDDYKYAIAGGGNMKEFFGEQNKFKCGAGIGVTRILEYLTEKKLFNF